MARRHLNYDVEVWRAKPWWQTRMYEEGLEWEFTPAETGVTEDGNPFEVVPLESLGVSWA